MSLFAINEYRNVYIKGYERVPFQKLKGKKIIAYSGEIICGVEHEPDKYEEGKDLYINCDCQLTEINSFVKIKNKTHVKEKGN